MKSKIVWCVLLLCTATFCPRDAATDDRAPDAIRKDCTKILGSNCTATQEELLRALLKSLDIYAVNKRPQPKDYSGDAPALGALPKDRFGMVNWVKAVTDGVIVPRGNITGAEETPYEGFLDNIILMPADVHIMADVAFPHGMHTYWLSCDSCHPKPFSKEPGTNKMVMKEIFEGKWCGKCHGKVSFPPSAYENCRRCHAISKKSAK